MAPPPIFRFAPSPNGRLHLGHAYSALTTQKIARQHNGKLLLRIEDIDIARCTPELEQGIYDDLTWLGFEWDGPVRRQSEHLDDYKAALDRLIAQGVVYRSYASRKEIEHAAAKLDEPALSDPDGQWLYPAACKRNDMQMTEDKRNSGLAHAWRLDMPLAVNECARHADSELSFFEENRGPNGESGNVTLDPAIWGDVIIARKDVPTSYHLAVVVDDALQGITHITRGQDLFYATGLHRLLQVLLELPAPRYHHHALIRESDGRKLSKSHDDKSLASLRAQGASASNIRRMIGLG